MSNLNPHPLFFQANNNNPAEAMDGILRALVKDPDVLGAASYVVQRNASICTGVKQVTFVYDGNGPIPASSLRQVPIITGIKEFICYLRAYTNVSQFQAISVNTWNKDATENQSWLNNPNRKGEGDIGVVYGALARNLVGPNGETKDVIAEVIQLLRDGNYNRRLIINFYDAFVRGALPACLYEHVFTVHGDYLNLSSTQRSNDSGLGGAINPTQCYFFLHLMARLTGYKVGWITHTVHDLHIYDSQVDDIRQYIDNEPLPATGQLHIGESIGLHTTLADLETMDISDIFTVSGYQSHGKYSIKLTV
jgi:thymidylate synthase